jgi:sortase A
MTHRAASRSLGRILELGCWAIGAVLIALYFGARAYGESERKDGIIKFSEARAAMTTAAASSLSPVARGETRLSEGVRSEKVQELENGAREGRTGGQLGVEVSERPLAVLRIHRVALELPVYGDVGERNLNRGAGLIAGTGMPGGEGNVAIAAHRDSYFRVLEHVVVGDLIALESLAGAQQYRVTELSIVEPDDLTPLQEVGVPALTLVTCYPFHFVGSAPQRYIVHAVATD